MFFSVAIVPKSRSQVLEEPIAGPLEGVHDLRRHLGVRVVAAHGPAVERTVEKLHGTSTRRLVKLNNGLSGTTAGLQTDHA